jgi:hypothetical protein
MPRNMSKGFRFDLEPGSCVVTPASTEFAAAGMMPPALRDFFDERGTRFSDFTLVIR